MKTRLIIVIFLLCNGIACYSQRVASISNVDFSLVENKLVITYQITNFNENDRFNIKAGIYKDSGEKINAISFSGDINGVTGGTNKRIVWDIEKDNIILEDEIYVQISGEIISGKVMSKPAEISDIIREPGLGEKKVTAPADRATCFFESLIFPGWGTSRLTQKYINITKGFLGYGAVIGAIIMNSKAKESYNNYKLAVKSADRDYYHEETQKWRQYSIISAGGAAAVWTVDLISVLAVKNRTIAQSFRTDNLNFSCFLTAESAQILTFKINF